MISLWLKMLLRFVITTVEKKLVNPRPKARDAKRNGRHSKSQLLEPKIKVRFPESKVEDRLIAEKLKTHRLMAVLTFIAVMAFAYWGINMVNFSANTEFTFLGVTFKSENVGIAVICIAAIIMIRGFRHILNSIDHADI